MLHLPTLTTARLTLRPFTLDDAEALRILASDHAIYRTTANIPHPYPEGQAEQWIATHHSQFYARKSVSLAITAQATGTLLGTIALHLHATNNRAELGYWVGVPYWGNGYCTEAAQAMLHYGFEVLDLHKIIAQHQFDNAASGCVMQKAGMQFATVLQDDVRKDGVYHDMSLYYLINPAHTTHA
jgi:RimJ/RimL family protein N-acetyltransferase